MYNSKLDVKEIKEGDVFSEVSHYVALRDYVPREGVMLHHMESGHVVNLTQQYVSDLLVTADSYTSEMEVGKEDKFWTVKQIDEQFSNLGKLSQNAPRVGDVRVKGIRTIWEELISAHVFTVCYQKADKSKTKKAIYDERLALINLGVVYIDKAKKDKKSMAEAYALALDETLNNPILDYIPGEERILRGYKIQFSSRDGKYDCIDMDIEKKGTESAIRPVNINTISYLVFDGVKYIVK